MRTFSGGGDHFVNFIDAVRAGDRRRLNADVEVGHLSTAVCHTGNIAYRVGRVASEKDQRAAVEEIPLLSVTVVAGVHRDCVAECVTTGQQTL